MNLLPCFPHDRLFSGFGDWIHITPEDLRRARSSVPYEPGLYEWGAIAPGGSGTIIAFYLGKAGTLKVWMSAGL